METHCLSCKCMCHEVAKDLVEPLWQEFRQLDGEANRIYEALAQVLGHFAQGEPVEAWHKLEVAKNEHQFTAPALSSLVRKTAELAKDRYAPVDKLQASLFVLLRRFQDQNRIIQSSQSLFAWRAG